MPTYTSLSGIGKITRNIRSLDLFGFMYRNGLIHVLLVNIVDYLLDCPVLSIFCIFGYKYKTAEVKLIAKLLKNSEEFIFR
jgi:hypothetical protein